MNYFGKAAEAANDILRAFQNPNTLPDPLAQIFIHRKDGVPSRAWSWRNQLLAALHGHADARGFRQWEQVGRHVKKGEKAFYILSPCTKTVVNEKTGDEKKVVYGFRGTAVFGLGQTEGELLPVGDQAVDQWLQHLPLRQVTTSWGISVEGFNGKGASCLGKFRHERNGNGNAIALGVKNLSTWAHELIHAADHRNGKLKELGQHWRSETVAELGGAVLLKILGYNHDADMGGCWEYVQRYATKAGIEVLRACNLVLERTCEAVTLILDTAETVGAKAGEKACC